MSIGLHSLHPRRLVPQILLSCMVYTDSARLKPVYAALMETPRRGMSGMVFSLSIKNLFSQPYGSSTVSLLNCV